METLNRMSFYNKITNGNRSTFGAVKTIKCVTLGGDSGLNTMQSTTFIQIHYKNLYTHKYVFPLEAYEWTS